ncbi:unnamed protein product, partial [Amoebophrya sp. A120]
KSTNISGTPVTMAPEVWNQSFGAKCDVWSLGVVLFQLLCGKLPFIAKTCKKKDWLAVLRLPPNWALLDHCSFQAQALCRAMLTYSDTSRPSASECCQYDWYKFLVRDANSQKSSPLPENAIQSLCQFHERSDLEKVVRYQMQKCLGLETFHSSRPRHFCNPYAHAGCFPAFREQTAEKLNAIFKKYDVDNNGTLSMEELAQALQELGVEQSTCHRAAQALDLDQSGEVEYTEFVAGCLNFFDDNLDHMLWQAFQKFDKDGSGSLSVTEIAELLSKGSEMGLGTLSPDANQVKAMIAKLDTNADGEVDWDEFRRFFTPKLE